MQSSTQPPQEPRDATSISHPQRACAARRALLLSVALLSASLACTGCADEEDPLGLGPGSFDAGGSGGTTGGGGLTTLDSSVVAMPDSSLVAPVDAGMLPVGNDAAIIPVLDSGAPGGGGQDAGGGAPGEGGVPDTDASVQPPRADLGKGDGSDVLMIGDSWMSLGSANSGIQGGILKASGQPYRAEGIGGTTLLGGGIIDIFTAPIPTQYQQAVQANPDVKTVIMTAGGNDILQTGLQEDCQMQGDACGEQVTKVLDALSSLWAEMAADGVQDLVYILYATPEGQSVDFMLPDGDGAKKRCAEVPAPLRCHIVETLDIVMGDIPDGIHPSQAASDRIGKVVVDLMAERGMRR